jgi:DDE_Tnp_1-associated
VSLRESLAGRLTDKRKPRGKRHLLPSLISVLVTGVAAGHYGPLAVAQAAAGHDQEVLAAHDCRISPRTGLRAAPSASMLDRLPKLLDPDELEAALTACLAAAALDPAIPAVHAARRAEERLEQEEQRKKRKRKPPAAESFREERGDSWFRAHPDHPWLDPAACGDPGHVPARPAVAVDGKERKLAKAGGKKKVHLLAAITHTPGLVIAQDKVAKSGKANEVTHFTPLLGPLPLKDVLITADAMQMTRDNALWLRNVKHAHFLFPVLGNQPNLNAQLNALPWETTPVAAATSEISRGRIETRTIRVLPAPAGTGFEDAQQAVLIERHATQKKKGRRRTSCEAVLYVTSLISHTRSNQLHRGNPPHRPGPPPRTPNAGPNMPLTRLNGTADFDESLADRGGGHRTLPVSAGVRWRAGARDRERPRCPPERLLMRVCMIVRH